MNDVDLRRKRGDRAGSGSSLRSLARNPYVLLGTGFALGALAPGAFRYMFFPVDGFFLSLTVLVVAVAVICYAVWLLLRKDPETPRPTLGSEKQLLLAILDSDGGITPVEAALETSLTVDEAEEILTRFADRGHLVVQSRDGALFYTLPGRRRVPDTRTV